MTHELTFEQIQNSKKYFDIHKNLEPTGEEYYMNVNKLINALDDLGFLTGKDEIDEFKKNMSLSNEIDFPTFLRITAIKFKQQELVKELEGAFKAFDKNNNEFLSYKELRSIITEYGPKLSLDEADEILKELDIQKDNKNFNYKDFVNDTI